ncbi:MAG: putative metal-dependent rane protease, partial [Mycobacterium sp.]|nr:putative metal-dependent rane protease [Mycobacterium sp.]
MRPSKVRAVALAAGLVGWSFAAPRVRWHPVPNASLGTGLVAVTRSPLGLRPPALWSGMRYGLAA